MVFVRWVGRISDVLGTVSMAQAVALIALMVYEVFCRFVLNAPNIWAFDITYMIAGTMFHIGAAYTLKANAHVRIDFISAHLPPAVTFAIETAFTAVLFLPILAFIAVSVFVKAWGAFATQQTDYTSPWNPLMWPFYTTIAFGLSGLWLQALARLVESILLRVRPARPNS